MSLLREQHARARELLDPQTLAYYEAGAGDEVSVREAEAVWRRYRLRPRVLRDVTTVDTSTTLFGTVVGSPVLVAPTGFQQLVHAEGELATARGTAAAGSLMVVSTRCSLPLEQVARAADGPWWFQVYATREPAVHRGLALRAKENGATALVLTVDTPVVGFKPRLDAVRIPDVDAMLAVNAGAHVPAGLSGAALAQALEQSPAATTDLIGELSELTGLPVLVKGVLRGDEAARCVDAGAAGVVVSAHGGRQLDRVVPSAVALPEVVAAVGDRVPVLVDGGVRSGVDALVALALGARAVLLGRPVLWALAADGADGVRAALACVTDELAHAMALAGAASLDALTPDQVAFDERSRDA